MSVARIKFWGVRGSMAAAGRSTVKFGGNTSCVELNAMGQTIILDAGTGIRELGNCVIKSGARDYRASIVLTHVHWDHFIGLPFFKPLYNDAVKLTLVGPPSGRRTFKSLLNQALSPPFFPLSLKKLRSIVKIRQISLKKFQIGDISVVPLAMSHPGGSLGFRFDIGSKNIAYVSDNEPSTDKAFDEMVHWLNDTGVLIHDAQYTPEIYFKRRGWGHSPYTYPIDLAAAANVKVLVLFHYDPDSSDADIKKIGNRAVRYARSKKYNLKIVLAREGLEMKI